MNLNLTAPTDWCELSQQQLEFLLRTITKVNAANNNRRFADALDFAAQSAAQVATLCLFEWNNIKLITPYDNVWLVARDGHEYLVRSGSITAASRFLGWTAELPSTPVRLEYIDGAHAAAPDLDDGIFSFDNFLSCEALWQAYHFHEAEDSKPPTAEPQILCRMAQILYHKPGIKLQEHELLSIFYWWAGIKNLCCRLYPHFFQPITPYQSTISQASIKQNIDAQIRALTKGDITKEEHVLAMPVHRALTELDALAREFDELNKKYPGK